MKQRLFEIEKFVEQPLETQSATFNHLIEKGQTTKFGQQHHFKKIKTETDFKASVPLMRYENLKPYVDAIMQGEQNVLWPDKIGWMAKSSGTTSDKSKFIPVSADTLENCHYRAARDVLAVYCRNYPDSQLFTGKGVILGGSHQVSQLNNNIRFGDLSAVLLQNMSNLGRFLSSLDLDIALMDKWESKIERMAEKALQQKITNLSGVPSWMMVFLKSILEKTGANNIKEVWPHLELYIHGGVSFTPYKSQFQQLMGQPINYLQTYNASEGFFALQDLPEADDMLLMLDLGIYYEFIPLDELDNEHPKSYDLSQVTLGENYAIVITTESGLWRYVLGDTVQFTSLNPHRIIVSGRTKHYINVFGEELMVDNTDKALAQACAQTNASIRDYTVGPIFMETQNTGGHEWAIEFENAPENIEHFTQLLDQHLQAINSDYEAKRYNDMALKAPKIHALPKSSFYNWLKQKGKLGGQNKVPRLSNSRKYLEEVLVLT